jgi:hypothetical protein
MAGPMNDTSSVVPHLSRRARQRHHPRPDAIARGWLSDLIKSCREEIKLTKRRITSYEVWERVLAQVIASEAITDDGEEVRLSADAEKQVRDAAQKMAEAAVQATGAGLAVRP